MSDEWLDAAAAADADELARRARVTAAVRDRHRSHASAARRTEALGIIDVLLGAHDHAVTVHTTAGAEALTGRVVWVGADVVELRASARRWWIRLDQVVAVHTSALAPGDPADRIGRDLLDVLGDLVDDDRVLIVHTTGGGTWRGVLDAAGSSLVLRRSGAQPHAVLAIEHVSAVGVADHGDG